MAGQPVGLAELPAGLIKWFDGLAAWFRRLAEDRDGAAVCRARLRGFRVRLGWSALPLM